MHSFSVSVTDASRSLGIGKTKTYDLINSGKLDTIKVGRRTLVTVHSLTALVGKAA